MREQAAQRRGIVVVVAGRHGDAGGATCGVDDRLIALGQLFPLFLVDVERHLGAAFPPARVVVILGDLEEAEFLVIVRADEFNRVERALFQRRINIARRDLLGHDPEFRQYRSGKAGGTHLQALEILDVLDFLAIPAAHLHARIAQREIDDVVGLVHLARQLHAIAFVHPGVHLARVQPKGDGRVEAEDRILAIVVIAAGMPHLDRILLHGIQNLERGDDFAAREVTDVELAVRGLAAILREQLAGAEQRIQAARETRRKAPVQGGRILRKHGRGNRCGTRDCANTGFLQKRTTLHAGSP